MYPLQHCHPLCSGVWWSRPLSDRARVNVDSSLVQHQVDAARQDTGLAVKHGLHRRRARGTGHALDAQLQPQPHSSPIAIQGQEQNLISTAAVDGTHTTRGRTIRQQSIVAIIIAAVVDANAPGSSEQLWWRWRKEEEDEENEENEDGTTLLMMRVWVWVAEGRLPCQGVLM